METYQQYYFPNEELSSLRARNATQLDELIKSIKVQWKLPKRYVQRSDVSHVARLIQSSNISEPFYLKENKQNKE